MTINKLWIAAAFLLCTFTLKAQNKMELTNKQQSLIEISAFEAKGDTEHLRTAINNGLDNGLTVNEIKEALTQLYAYTGFPRSLNALSVLQRVVADKTAAGQSFETGKDYAEPQNFDALKAGTQVQTKLCGGTPFNYTFAPRIDYYLKAHLFGDIFASNVLSESDREIVTVSAVSTLEGCDPQLTSHVSGALNMGVTQAQLKSIPKVLEEKVGLMEAYRVRRAVAITMGETFNEGMPVDFSIWPKGELNTAYAKYFIGDSYLASMDAQHGGPVNVTFEPRCRNNWHIHHNCVQILICVAGRGWYQEEGKEAVEMLPGSVIAIPAEAKHWHGAAKDSWFQHLTYTANAGENATTEWLEPVTDSEYDKLK